MPIPSGGGASTATVADLVNDIYSRLHSFTGLREQVTYLLTPVTTTETTLQVANGDRISRGLIEVNDELMLVEAVESNSVRLFPFGRAQDGSTAASHDLNTKVTNDPLLPTVQILKAIQETCLQVHPDLFQVKTTQITYSPAKVTYDLPGDVDRVLQVTAQTPGPSGMWPVLRNYRYDQSAATTSYLTGKSLDVYDRITSGYKLNVTYAAPYGTPQAMTDTVESLGIQDSVREVILLGACWRLTQNLEPARLQIRSVEQLARQEAVPPGAITNLAKQFYAQFQLRATEERKRLLALHPQQIFRTR